MLEKKEIPLDFEGTKLTFSISLPDDNAGGFWVNTGIRLENEYTRYEDEMKIPVDEIDEWVTTASRLLAGAYKQEYTLSFGAMGFAVDFYPHTENGMEVSREERRNNDCVMAIRLLMRTADKTSFLGGVYTFLVHRKDVARFAAEMRDALDFFYGRFAKTSGKYLFVGVSPLGYQNCSYWYLDESKTVEKGEYVWVRMGRRNTEQIVTVDRVRYCDENTSPFPPENVKRVLRKATQEEINELNK